MSARLTASLSYYGIAPFEVEALYSILNGVYSVWEDKLERPDDDNFASMVEITFPLEFSEEFFESFGRRRWNLITYLLKEMRRRTGKKGVHMIMHFSGTPLLSFDIAMHAENLFEMALEKMEALTDFVSLQIDSTRLPGDVSEVRYEFDPQRTKWYPKIATGNGTQYTYDSGEWTIYNEFTAL